jgi:EAL domain-containing protein (putative c-di-GMP-specific phosphodiesterase class I)
LPIDTLKIDKAFVQALVDSEKASAVIRGIVALARSLGMKTIAEGVESQCQVAELKEAGCDVIPGYLISLPLESDALPAFLRTRAPARPDRRPIVAWLTRPCQKCGALPGRP